MRPGTVADASAAVDLAPVPELDDEHDEALVLDPAENAVVTDSVAPEGRAPQLLSDRSRVTRLVHPLAHEADERPGDLLIELGELALGAAGPLDGIGHLPYRSTTSSMGIVVPPEE